MLETIMLTVRCTANTMVAEVVEAGIVRHVYEVVGAPNKHLAFKLGEKVSKKEGEILSFIETIYNGYKTKTRQIFVSICSCGSERYRDLIEPQTVPGGALDADELEAFTRGIRKNLRGR